jgi:hypothetical protein
MFVSHSQGNTKKKLIIEPSWLPLIEIVLEGYRHWVPWFMLHTTEIPGFCTEEGTTEIMSLFSFLVERSSVVS